MYTIKETTYPLFDIDIRSRVRRADVAPVSKLYPYNACYMLSSGTCMLSAAGTCSHVEALNMEQIMPVEPDQIISAK